MQYVALRLTGIALTSTIDMAHLVVYRRVGGAEVHKGVVHAGLAVACLGSPVVVKEFAEPRLRIVIGTVAATEDGVGAALQIFGVGRGRQHVGTGLVVWIVHLA